MSLCHRTFRWMSLKERGFTQMPHTIRNVNKPFSYGFFLPLLSWTASVDSYIIQPYCLALLDILQMAMILKSET